LTAYRLIDARNLVDFIKQIENKEAEVPDFLFRDFADKWLESIKPHLKETGYARRISSLTQIVHASSKIARMTLSKVPAV
jgi:hypothetical protein